MSLNKVRQLDDQQLLQLLNENGYENIATILNERNIDGKKFLELSEFQTRFWKLSALQQKTLFNFIEKLNENPFIIIKREPIAKVNITLNLPTAPTYKPSSPPKPPIRNYQTAGQEFKQKLEISLGANSSPNISPPSPNISPTKNILPRSPKPKPLPIEPIQDNNRDLNKKTRQLPAPPPPISHETINSKQILPEHGKVLKSPIIEKNKKSKPPPPPPVSNEEKPKPEPASVTRQISSQNLKPKTKLLPMEPSDIEKIKSKPIMHLLNNENKFSHNSREGIHENEYENLIQIKPNGEYGYVSADELEFAYENSDVIRLHATRNRVPILENFYKIAPSNPKPVTPPPEILVEPSPNTHKENKLDIIKKSPVADRPPLPLPKEPISNNQSKSLDNLRTGMSDSDNYDSIEQNEIRQMRNKIQTIGGYLDLDAGNVQLTHSVNLTDSSFAHKTKYDPQNIIISEQDQLKRNNLLGSISRLFKKSEIREPTFQLYDYENYMLKSEVPSVVPEEAIISFKNRPLPEIPTSTRRSLNAEIPSFSSNVQEITTNRGFHLVEPIVTPYTESTQQDDEIYENLKGNDNFDTSNSSSIISGFQKNKNTSSKLLFHEELALKLSEALKVRDNINSSHITIPKQKIPTGHDIEDKTDINQKHLYGNIDSITAAHQSHLQLSHNILRNKLASKALVVNEDDIDDDDFDEFDETPPPHVYENLNDSELVQIEVEKPLVGAKMTHIDEHENYYQIVNFSNEKFFKNTDRNGAKDLLKNLPDGSFLFRPSETYFLVLTLKYKGRCYNLGIERSNNKIKLNADTGSISPEFETLQAFVEYFTKEAITFRDHNDAVIEIFLNPVFRK